MDYFATSLQHILAELERIDVLIRAQVWRARQVHLADSDFQGLVITEEEVDDLMAGPAGLPRWATEPAPAGLAQVQAALTTLNNDVAQRKATSNRLGIPLRLDDLSRLFELSPFELDALLICMAPEIDLRYERLFAYLQDDVTKKRPSVDLVLNLLAADLEEKLALRKRFGAGAPLVRHRLLRLFEDPSRQEPTLLGKYLKVDQRIVDFLLGQDGIDPRLAAYVRPVEPATGLESVLLAGDLGQRLLTLAQAHRSQGLVLYLQGPYGVGKRTTAEALCWELGLGCLQVDGRNLMAASDLAVDEAVDLLVREARLSKSALFWDGFDALVEEGPSELPEAGIVQRTLRQTLVGALEQHRGLTFLAGETTWEPANALHAISFVRVEFPRPAFAERYELWQHSLDGSTPDDAEDELRLLADKFRFSGGQIRDASATARNLARLRDPQARQVTLDDLYQASRLQSNRKLAALARKITPHYGWSDIVLPPDRLQQLREICNYVKFRAQVYDQWGFDRKLAMGKGLNALFAGPSGTGKTMAAEIIAGDLGLDLYKIDLSTVVSKYIGETEKNLSRIFAEAETSNAILFFDEADALFGKRSEVRDAHDRYANIEISYLLQKMEEYEGVAILATNLRKNMDDAFVRRMHFTVEFPFPDATYRARIWQKIWPAETPISQELDLAFMAQRFELAGGSIRNIALAASFLAAADDRPVDMGHLMRATQREYQKMGKVIRAEEFGSYARLIREGRSAGGGNDFP